MERIPNENSYNVRRLLFKNIWEAAMDINEKDDVNKPKVIKTLRLSGMDKYTVGKNKKQRIKNLRHVCKKILDFCDRQDVDDLLFDQMAEDGEETNTALLKIDAKSPKKTKTHRIKKKIKKTKSMSSPPKDITQVKGTASEQKDVITGDAMVVGLINDSPIQVKRIKKTIKSKLLKDNKPRKHSGSGSALVGDNKSSRVSAMRRRATRKKYTKKKKSADCDVQVASNIC